VTKLSKKNVEALLFISKEVLKIQDICKILEEDEPVILRYLFELQQDYKDRGIRIRQVAGGFEMVTSEECYDAIEKLVPKEFIDGLTPSVLETVAIIAFHQPMSRANVGKYRGKQNPDYAINQLIDRKLIKESEEGFVTTENFLKYFGLNDIKELSVETFGQKNKLEI
jgi:segregation and condensation protein B